MKPETIKIDDIEYVRKDHSPADLNKLIELNKQASPYEIGKNYFIRTVTHYFTGLLVAVHPQELVLQDAAWIADTGRFSKSLKEGFKEIEPYPSVYCIVGRGAIIDASILSISLPRDIK